MPNLDLSSRLLPLIGAVEQFEQAGRFREAYQKARKFIALLIRTGQPETKNIQIVLCLMMVDSLLRGQSTVTPNWPILAARLTFGLYTDSEVMATSHPGIKGRISDLWNKVVELPWSDQEMRSLAERDEPAAGALWRSQVYSPALAVMHADQEANPAELSSRPAFTL